MLIDTHAHLDFAEFDSDRAELFQQMYAQGITGAIIPAVNQDNWQRVKHTAWQHACYYALGIHPWFTPKTATEINSALQKITCELDSSHKDPLLVAVGETGLDKLKKQTFSLQLKLLQGQISLANRYQLPIILHCVKAHNELIECLSHSPVIAGGVIHGFSGSESIANKYIDLGFKLGIGGLVLNKNAKKLRNTLTQVSVNELVVETDSPAMSPTPHARNTPLILPAIVNEIACLQNKSIVFISEQLKINTRQLFDL